MAFTQTQLDVLDAAIAEGVLTVKYQDRQVTFRSLDEMVRTRKMMADSLKTTATSTRENPMFSKGL